MSTLKPSKTFQEQLDLLAERGMNIENQEQALKSLQQMNYYRLMGYAFQYKEDDGARYHSGTSFQQVLHLYLFDQEFRRVLFTYLEIIEIYARTQIAYYFSQIYGSDGHYKARNFIDAGYHKAFLETLNLQMQKNKNSAFVAHHIQKYEGKMPIWVAVEVLSFSALSKFYKNIEIKGRAYIAAKMGFENKYIVNWLHCFSVLRNTCAHYGRIYNSSMKPEAQLGAKTLRAYPQIEKTTIFAYIIAMVRFLPTGKDAFIKDVIGVVSKWADCVDFGLLGFPSDWREVLSDKRLLYPTTKSPQIKKP